jgi:pyruvate,orthophosphate dikinase
MNAQGEDVVAGIRTPHPIADLSGSMPEMYREIERITGLLEKHYRDVQDVEFTIQEGTLYILQTRSGKRTAKAAVKIAVDMVEEGLIDRKTAIRRIDEKHLEQFLHPTFDPKADRTVIGKGLPASPGAAVGKVVFTADEAEEAGSKGEKVILVRIETSPEDIGGMHAAQGILTARGGMTSHAAVVARGMGKCCVAGCSDIEVDVVNGRIKGRDGTVISRGEFLSLDGSNGEVIAGAIPTLEPELGSDFQTLMEWADEVRSLGVWANADTPEDARTARRLGAEGIGLARTEHMFFDEVRIKAVREMILSHTKEQRVRALEKLLPMQRDNFVGLFREMDGLPITIRLLDPPLHEFLPHEPEAQRAIAEELDVSVEALRAKVESLREFNPMLGHRGCRLGITFPEIYEMQARAIFLAACESKKSGVKVIPEIMLPLIGTVTEFRFLRDRIVRVGKEVFAEQGIEIDYHIGTMIEVPRAALTAGEIGGEADFFSFGTNDLTQMTFGYSRDDAGSFIAHYVEHGILPDDPFQTIDVAGVGRIMEIAVADGRGANANLKVGICGEHGGDPRSIFLCRKLGMDYVSCSPFRVPIARLAAAQAEIVHGES